MNESASFFSILADACHCVKTFSLALYSLALSYFKTRESLIPLLMLVKVLCIDIVKGR